MANADEGRKAIRLNFSHLGIHVSDLARMEDFYTRVLGFYVTDRGQLSGPAGPMDLAQGRQPGATAEAHARALPGFKPRSQRRAEMARRMGLGRASRTPRG